MTQLTWAKLINARESDALQYTVKPRFNGGKEILPVNRGFTFWHPGSIQNGRLKPLIDAGDVRGML